jgi:hypothetical protein
MFSETACGPSSRMRPHDPGRRQDVRDFLAGESGAAQQALELSTAYICEREQFGRPLRASQAVQQQRPRMGSTAGRARPGRDQRPAERPGEVTRRMQGLSTGRQLPARDIPYLPATSQI